MQYSRGEIRGRQPKYGTYRNKMWPEQSKHARMLFVVHTKNSVILYNNLLPAWAFSKIL